MSEVWVLEPTDFDEYGIHGVYESAEAARADAYPKCDGKIDWVENADGSWAADRHYWLVYREPVKTLAEVNRNKRNG